MQYCFNSFNMLTFLLQALALRLSFLSQMPEVVLHGSSRGGWYVYLFLALKPYHQNYY